MMITYCILEREFKYRITTIKDRHRQTINSQSIFLTDYTLKLLLMEQIALFFFHLISVINILYVKLNIFTPNSSM